MPPEFKTATWSFSPSTTGRAREMWCPHPDWKMKSGFYSEFRLQPSCMWPRPRAFLPDFLLKQSSFCVGRLCQRGSEIRAERAAGESGCSESQNITEPAIVSPQGHWCLQTERRKNRILTKIDIEIPSLMALLAVFFFYNNCKQLLVSSFLFLVHHMVHHI